MCLRHESVSLFKLKRSRASSDWTLSGSRMIKFLRNRPGPDETSGSAAASQTSSLAKEEEKSTSRTLTVTPPLFSKPLRPARSTRSMPEKTCAGERSSFTMCPASLFSHWCLTSTRLRGVRSVTRWRLTDPEVPNMRRLTTGSSCREDSVTLYLCPPSCPALRPFTLLLMLPATTTALLHVTPAISPQRCQVSFLTSAFLKHRQYKTLMHPKFVKVEYREICQNKVSIRRVVVLFLSFIIQMGK